MTKKYKIVRGRYARTEGNVVKHYAVNDFIQLTDEEAAEIVSLIELAEPPKPITGSPFRSRG